MCGYTAVREDGRTCFLLLIEWRVLNVTHHRAGRRTEILVFCLFLYHQQHAEKIVKF